MSKHIETKTVEFHSEILTKVLEGFSIPTSVYSTLELLLNQISNGIKLSKSSGTEAQQYWIMLTKYNYQSVTKTVQTGEHSFPVQSPVFYLKLRSTPVKVLLT